VYPQPEPPYNPLDKGRLAESVVRAMLEREPRPLPPPEFLGAGIYALYYCGDFAPYAPIAERNRDGRFEQPIYVGRSKTPGARRGGVGALLPETSALHSRLKEHSVSISRAINLRLEDFACRYLVVDDIWIPLAESLLIQEGKPLWNVLVDGFGNHPPGTGRTGQRRSAWDVLHPGRPWAERVQPHNQSIDEVLRRVSRFLTDPDEAARVMQLRFEDYRRII
jgi:hypothetical protein